MKFKDSIYKNQRLSEDIIHPVTGKIIIPANRKLAQYLIDKAEDAGIKVTVDMFAEPRSRISQPNKEL